MVVDVVMEVVVKPLLQQGAAPPPALRNFYLHLIGDLTVMEQ